MIAIDNLRIILNHLNDELGAAHASETILIMGGGAMVATGLSSRATVDLDIALPQINKNLQAAAKSIAKSFGLSEDWLNTAGSIFAKLLPPGWQDRSQLFFEASHLKAYHLANEDLIFTKCLAYFDRAKISDLNDLAALSPNASILNRAEKWLLSIKERDESTSDVSLFFNNLKRKLADNK